MKFDYGISVFSRRPRAFAALIDSYDFYAMNMVTLAFVVSVLRWNFDIVQDIVFCIIAATTVTLIDLIYVEIFYNFQGIDILLGMIIYLSFALLAVIWTISLGLGFGLLINAIIRKIFIKPGDPEGRTEYYRLDRFEDR